MDKNRRNPQGFSILTLAISVVVVLLWAANIYLLKDAPDRGTYGDMFGAVNALFSGLAFSGIIITILLQREELTLQREELGFTRDEIRGQKEQMELQNHSLKTQLFESTFFALLKNQNDITENITIEFNYLKPTSGRQNFRGLYDRLKFHYDRRGDNKSFYNIFYKENQEHIAHYFQHFHLLLTFVDKSDIEDKRFYTNIVRAQLSSFESAILFYHALNSKTLDLKALVETYGLVSLMSPSLLLNGKDDYNLYIRGAFEI